MVEKLELGREPLQLEAVYFISPTNPSIDQLAEDQNKGLYTACHVFFTSAVGNQQLTKIRTSGNLVRKLKTLKEVKSTLCSEKGLESSLGKFGSDGAGCSKLLDRSTQCPVHFLSRTRRSSSCHVHKKIHFPWRTVLGRYELEMESAVARLATVFLTLNVCLRSYRSSGDALCRNVHPFVISNQPSIQLLWDTVLRSARILHSAWNLICPELLRHPFRLHRRATALFWIVRWTLFRRLSTNGRMKPWPTICCLSKTMSIGVQAAQSEPQKFCWMRKTACGRNSDTCTLQRHHRL